MENTNWLKQSADNPLFPDLLWNRPVNKRHAGKLLIIGGNKYSFAAVANAFKSATDAGIGSARILLPDSLRKTVSAVFPEAIFASSGPSGSFNRQALATLLEEAKWADAVLLAGDFGHNAETSVLVESFLSKYSGLLTIAGDTLDFYVNSADALSMRKDLLIVASFSQLQKLSTKKVLLKHTMDLYQLVGALNLWTERENLSIITSHADHAIVCCGGRCSTTKTSQNLLVLACFASVWWLQQPNKIFESLSTAVFESNK